MQQVHVSPAVTKRTKLFGGTRNIWRSERPVPLIKAVLALIHEDVALEDATAILETGSDCSDPISET